MNPFRATANYFAKRAQLREASRAAEEKSKNYAMMRNAVHRGKGGGVGRIEGYGDLKSSERLRERDLNAAIVSFPRVWLGGGVDLNTLNNAVEYVENHLEGAKQAKYEVAILKRAERLKTKLASIRDKVKQEYDSLYANASASDKTTYDFYKSSRYLSRDYGVRQNQLNEVQKVIDRLGRKSRTGGLETVTATTAIIGLVAGIFFLSPNFTGNVIGNITNSSSNILGAVLLIIGLVGGFFWLRNRR